MKPEDYLNMTWDQLPATLQATLGNMSPLNLSSMQCFVDVVQAWQLAGERELSEEQVFETLKSQSV